MTHENLRRSALAGLALLTAAGAPALAQQGRPPAPPGGAPAQQEGLTPNADWHRTVDDPEKLGRGLRAALERTDSRRAG